MILSFWLSYSLSPESSVITSSGEQNNSEVALLSGQGFPPFALQGPLYLPKRSREAWLPRDRRRATAGTHTPTGPGLVDMAAQGPRSVSSANASPTSVSPPTPPLPSAAISKSALESKATPLSPQPCSAGHEDLLPLAVFYGPLDAKNPLLATCEKEIQELLGFMKRKKALATTEERKHEFHRLW